MMTLMCRARWITAGLAVAVVSACSGPTNEATPGTPPAATPAAPPVTPPVADDAPLPATPSPYDALPESARLLMDKPFTGDLDAMIARRLIRVAVTFNRTHYFVDRGQERGLTYESLKLLENDLNQDLKTGNLKVHVATSLR